MEKTQNFCRCCRCPSGRYNYKFQLFPPEAIFSASSGRLWAISVWASHGALLSGWLWMAGSVTWSSFHSHSYENVQNDFPLYPVIEFAVLDHSKKKAYRHFKLSISFNSFNSFCENGGSFGSHE